MTTAALADPSQNGHAPQSVQSVRLNIGAGGTHLLGFTDLDRDTGQEAYPLPHADNSVEEIVASHVLEHFGHREVSLVLQDWVRALKPGGKIRLAVPDFEEIAKLYLKGAPVNVQGHVMGGHMDADDKHGCIFDRESLTELMMQCGLERIGPWTCDTFGCAAGPHSLNLQGYKPLSKVVRVEGVRAIMSTPRFGPLIHPKCAQEAFAQLGIPARQFAGCFWHQTLSNLMEGAIASEDCRFVLTMDFDTVFSAHDVLELYRLMIACPGVDAVFPLQSRRGVDQVLVSLPGGGHGRFRSSATEGELSQNLLPALTGHFGLTLFRADSLRKFPRPWMCPEPNEKGQWHDGNIDADIDFWRRFKNAGFKVCLAPKVVVGHVEEQIKWPGQDMRAVFQSLSDYEEVGIPAEARR